MSQNKQDRSAHNTVNAIIACWIIAGILALTGGMISLGSMSSPAQVYSHSGVLVDTTRRQGRGHNTTLLILKEDGSLDHLEVKSSLQVREISKIRNIASEHRGERVIYYRSQKGAGRLVSVETVDGTTIVSAEHTLAARRFTGIAMLIFALILAAAGFFLTRPRRYS